MPKLLLLQPQLFASHLRRHISFQHLWRCAICRNVIRCAFYSLGSPKQLYRKLSSDSSFKGAFARARSKWISLHRLQSQ